jgi:phosphoenolpyruvate carboxykinase (diphosphate)
LLGNTVTMDEELSYATDNKYPDIHVLPEDMDIRLSTQTASYTHYKTGKNVTIRVLPYHTYMHPSGFKIYIDRHPNAANWRLIGTLAEPCFCHKPSTVSGGGKSEISKSLNDAVIYGPIFIGNYEQEMSVVQSIIERDYSKILLPQYQEKNSDTSRPILASSRTLGSVIKLLTPDDIYTPEHNDFVTNIPNQIRAIVFAIKSAFKPDLDEEDDSTKDWKKLFTVDMSNGVPGHELKYKSRQLVGTYLRVGYLDGQWRNYKLRQDFIAATKVQMEDDITASIVVPQDQIYGLPNEYKKYPSLKISQNCEWRLFQRPDDAIHPGFDKQTEHDMAGPGIFLSNFEPLSRRNMQQLSERIYFYDLFTEEMRQHILDCANGVDDDKDGHQYNICSAKPRIVEGGVPTKNPRYLQVRPDVERPVGRYMAEMGARLYRRLDVSEPCIFPVAGVLSGRRNNPPDELNGKKIRPLCVYNPIHYQELPELLMDYICCVTGKSPSTTGAGSEGALSKGPFNAIGATADLNNMLVSMILCGYGGYSSAAGYIGPKYRIDHDVSLLIPELWCRMTSEERDPNYLIQNQYLEPINDFVYNGRIIQASRLGYRITKHFVHHFFCRIFDNPSGVFTDEMLRPEIQDMDVFVDGIENICQAMQHSALYYFDDGIINDACPPLRAVLSVMAYGHYHNKTIQDPIIRNMFTLEYLLNSEWYKQRLYNKQQHDIVLWTKNLTNLQSFMERPGYTTEVEHLHIREQLNEAQNELKRVSSPEYYQQLIGTIGKDNIHDGYQLVVKQDENGNDMIPTDIEPIQLRMNEKK